MHLDTGVHFGTAEEEKTQARQMPARAALRYSGSLREDRELEEIFQRTYGPIKNGHYFDVKPVRRERAEENFRLLELGQDYLLVDGYNILFAWDELKKLAA